MRRFSASSNERGSGAGTMTGKSSRTTSPDSSSECGAGDGTATSRDEYGPAVLQFEHCIPVITVDL